MSNEIERYEPAPDDRKSGVERMERFQALQAGHYWRALRSFPDEGIDQGEVLLVESIRWADDAPHTVVVRAHPDKYGKSYPVAVTQADGRTWTSHRKHETHRFLVDEFLIGFEYEPDYERIRAAEIQAVQGRISELQAELIGAQSDPKVLGRVVDDEFARRDAEKAAKGEPVHSLPALPMQPSELLGGARLTSVMRVGMTEETVEAMRGVAERQHEIATIKANWIRGKTEEIGETVKAMTPYFEEQAAAALARTEDVRNHVDRLKRGIETLDLYVGKGVEVETIRTGRSADREEPLTLMQRKLMVDEELAIWCDIDQWFDFTKDELFVEALQQHRGLIDQIFPAQRCVVAMATTRRHIDYGDAWTNIAKDAHNKAVFLLIRDGENIHRVYSPVESHLGSHRLFPSQNEMEGIFTGIDGTAVGLDDVAYTDKLGVYELSALHYKRFLVLLCGLDHRLGLFGDFYRGEKTLDFVSMEFQERHMRFLFDDEGSTALAETPRPPVDDWIEEMNRYLVSGSRVMCNWSGLMNPDTAPAAVFEYSTRDFGSRMDRRFRAKTDMSVAVAARRGQDLVVEVEVKGHGANGKPREFSCTVNLSAHGKGRWDDEQLAYLCLDAVRPEDIHWYIHDRRTRRGHVRYVRFFKTALKHLEAERAAEADIRARMQAALVEGGLGLPEDHAGVVDRTILAWRAANRGRPFPSFDGDRAPREWKGVLEQMFSLAGQGRDRTERIADFARGKGWQPLRVAVTGKGRLALYAAPAPGERDDRLLPHAWVHRVEVEPTVDGIVELSRRWVVLAEVVASETTLQSWPEGKDWFDLEGGFQSPSHKRAVFDLVGGWRERAERWLASDDASLEAMFLEWHRVREQLLKNSRNVVNPALVVPVGLRFDATRPDVRLVAVQSIVPHAMIHDRAGEDLRRRLRADFVDCFRERRRGNEKFDEAIEGRRDWDIVALPLPAEAEALSWSDMRDDGPSRHLTQDAGRVPLLRDRFEVARKREDRRQTYWFGADGDFLDLEIDAVLGNRIPDDYEVLVVQRVKLDASNGAVTSWIDIVPEAMARKDGPSGGMSWLSGDALAGRSWSGSSRVVYSRRQAEQAARSLLEEGERLVDEVEDASVAPAPLPDVGRLWILRR